MILSVGRGQWTVTWAGPFSPRSVRGGAEQTARSRRRSGRRRRRALTSVWTIRRQKWAAGQ
ncbi:hypothetical protein ABZ815_11995 [Nonomuraea sp. NPDC047529]|uniref:hypothetical protein n=1 Tax=Nonomuraea sp. NPDC047529 TaxID=3155623 RepID=UPI0033C9BEA6